MKKLIILTIFVSVVGCVQREAAPVAVAPELFPMRGAVSASVGDLDGNPPAEISGAPDLASLLSFFAPGKRIDDTTYRIGAGEYQAHFRMRDGKEIGVLISSSVWETHDIQGQMKAGWRDHFASQLKLKGKNAHRDRVPHR